MLQIMDSEGRILDQKYLDFLKLDPLWYLRIYRKMLTGRLFAKRATEEATIPNHGRTRLMALYISLAGQEAVLASALTLDPEDLICFYARSHEEAIARDIKEKALFDIFFGNPCPDSIKDFLQKETWLPHSFVGGHLLHAVGYIWAAKIRGQKKIAVAY